MQPIKGKRQGGYQNDTRIGLKKFSVWNCKTVTWQSPLYPTLLKLFGARHGPDRGLQIARKFFFNLHNFKNKTVNLS